MIGLLQRVTHAQVWIDQQKVGQIERGLAVLIGIETRDTPAQARALLRKLLTYRVFADADGRMNRSLSEVAGGLLLVPQFTLAADTRKGLRPGFERAAAPAIAGPLFSQLVDMARTAYPQVACGRFGANMQLSLTNDGPVTFWLQT